VQQLYEKRQESDKKEIQHMQDLLGKNESQV
jgi:hypothetical protein